jgi:hypothetical protein
MGNSNPFLGINRFPSFPKYNQQLVMNIRIRNRESAWKVAGRLGIIKRKRKETKRRERMDRNIKMSVEINEIEKIERNLMENSGAKN